MLTTIGDLKGAFVAMVPRTNGIPLGRTSFQDFEISYFLNAAYDKCLQARVGQLMQAYAQAFQVEDHHADVPRRDVPYGGLISEFGTLFRSSVHLPDWEPADFPFSRQNLLWNEEMSHIFEVMPVNGFVPYIIGCDLFETRPGVRIRGTTRKEGALSVTYPVRILNESEVLKFSLLLNRSPNTLPYRFGRIRADVQMSYTASVSNTIDYLDEYLQSLTGAEDPMAAVSDRIALRRQVYLLELLHIRQFEDSDLSCSMQFICHPEPITEYEISAESGRLLEVSFGHEIVETAAHMAAGLISAGAPAPAQQAQPANG